MGFTCSVYTHTHTHIYGIHLIRDIKIQPYHPRYTRCQKLETDVTYFFIFTKQVNISVCLFWMRCITESNMLSVKKTSPNKRYRYIPLTNKNVNIFNAYKDDGYKKNSRHIIFIQWKQVHVKTIKRAYTRWVQVLNNFFYLGTFFG